jgi:hypothetical protein
VRDFHDEHSDALDEQFGFLRNNVTMLVPVPPAEEIVARGRRRRQTARVVVVSLAVVLAVGAGYSVLRPLRPVAVPNPPAGGSPSIAVVPYTPTEGSTRARAGETIPAGFLPAEGRTVVERKGIGRQCPGGVDPASDFDVKASQSLRDAQGGQVTLLVYPTAALASRAFNEYEAEVQRCDSVTEALGFGGESMRVTWPPPRTEIVVRNGAALLLVGGDDAGAVDRVFAGLLDRLCHFASDCRPRGGRPGALASLEAGGEAWAVVLATDSSGDPAVLGRAVAAAANMGFRASVASVDCDEGARSALGLPDGTQKYVAVYFASRADADAFADNAIQRPIGTIQVRTYCIG